MSVTNTLVHRVALVDFALASDDNHIITMNDSLPTRPGVIALAVELKLKYPDKVVLFIDDEGFVANLARMVPGHSICYSCDLGGFVGEQVCEVCGGNKIFPDPAVFHADKTFGELVQEAMDKNAVRPAEEDEVEVRRNFAAALGVVARWLETKDEEKS